MGKTAALLALDALGALLFALGAVGKFGNGDLVPVAWRFDGLNTVLIAAGIVLMLPYMLHVLVKARHQAESRTKR